MNIRNLLHSTAELASKTKFNNHNYKVSEEIGLKTINHKIKKEWNKLWKQQSNRTHLRKIKLHIHQNNPTLKFNRNDQVILTRIRIGHTRVTHQHLITKDNPPICEKCNVPINIDHILLDCTKYQIEREKFKCNKQLYDLLNKKENCSMILKFLQDISMKNGIL